MSVESKVIRSWEVAWSDNKNAYRLKASPVPYNPTHIRIAVSYIGKEGQTYAIEMPTEEFKDFCRNIEICLSQK